MFPTIDIAVVRVYFGRCGQCLHLQRKIQQTVSLQQKLPRPLQLLDRHLSSEPGKSQRHRKDAVWVGGLVFAGNKENKGLSETQYIGTFGFRLLIY